MELGRILFLIPGGGLPGGGLWFRMVLMLSPWLVWTLLVIWVMREPEAASTSGDEQAAQSSPDRIPPYHASEEAAKPFPVTLSPDNFSESAVAHAYRVAKEMPGLIAQQPCYCWCTGYGHTSLLDCYASNHGAG